MSTPSSVFAAAAAQLSEKLAMQRDREDWDNEGGQLHPDPEMAVIEPSHPAVHQFDASLTGNRFQKAIPVCLTVAAFGVGLAVAFS